MAVCVILASAPVWLASSPYALSVGVGILTFAVPAMGAWLLLNGGLWSFGQGVFSSLGAYTAALLMLRFGVEFWPALIAGGAAGGLASALLIYPFLRTSGVTFSILTLVALSAFDELVLLLPELSGGGGGLIGVPGLPRTNVFGLRLNSVDGQYAIILVIVVLCLLAMYRLERGGYLRTLRAVARNECLAEAVGVSSVAMRASAFIFAGVFGGLAGAFSAAELQAAQQSVWDVFPSIYIVAYGIVGGTRSVFGALLGTTVVMGISSELASLGSLSSNSVDPILIGGGLILVVLVLPEGLASIASRVVKVGQLSRRFGKTHAG